jgi:hypothetical protein
MNRNTLAVLPSCSTPQSIFTKSIFTKSIYKEFKRISRPIVFIVCIFTYSQTIYADHVLQANATIIDQETNELYVTLSTADKSWALQVSKDAYLGPNIPLIGVSVTTGEEMLIDTLDNCYYRGTSLDNDGNTIAAYINWCNSEVPFTGFVADADYVYIIQPDTTSPTGLAVEISDPDARLTLHPDIENDNGWKEGGSGGNDASTILIDRRPGTEFPSLEIYIDPDFIANNGEDKYLDRIFETLAFANFAYAQSGIKQISLVAIIQADDEIGRTEDTHNLLHGLERLRNRTIQPNSADVAAIFTGKDRTGTGYWGWAEIGYSCERRIAMSEGTDVHTHKVAKGAFVFVDLPTLMQRGWTLAHEMGHTLGAEHVIGDYIMDGQIELVPTLSAYTLTCPSKIQFYESCAFDSNSKKVTDFYACP